MTCAEGGLVVTDDEQLAQNIRSLKFHGLGVDAYDMAWKEKIAVPRQPT